MNSPGYRRSAVRKIFYFLPIVNLEARHCHNLETLDYHVKTIYNKNMNLPAPTSDENSNADVDVPLSFIMRGLTQELPLNDFGLPTGIYRTDLLPFHLWNQTPVEGECESEGEFTGPDTRSTELGSTETEDDPSTSQDAGAIPVAATAPALLTRPSPQYPGSHPSEEDNHPDGLTIEVANSPDSLSFDGFEDSVDPFLILEGTGDGINHNSLLSPPTKRQDEGSDTNTRSTELAVEEPLTIAGFPAAAIQAAFVPLQYDEGFPGFEDGRAFWARMDFEPADAFAAFDRYIKLPTGSSPDYDNDDDYGVAATGSRSLNALVAQLYPRANDDEVLQHIERFKEYFHTFYWGLRTKSYDMFKVAQYRHQQEIRAIETLDDHYVQARRLRHRLNQYMDSEEDFWDLMTPKTAIDMHKHLTELERQSAGVQASRGRPGAEGETQGQPFEIAFRTIAQAHAPKAAEEAELDGELLDQDGNVLDRALEDPNATAILQELIIRTGGGTKLG